MIDNSISYFPREKFPGCFTLNSTADCLVVLIVKIVCINTVDYVARQMLEWTNLVIQRLRVVRVKISIVQDRASLQR